MANTKQKSLVPRAWIFTLGALVYCFMTCAPSLAATPACTAAAAQQAAPAGMTIGPIKDLNPALPPVPTGALLVPASASTPSYCLVTGSVVTNADTGKTANFGIVLPFNWKNRFLFIGCGGFCGSVFQSPPNDPRGRGFPYDALSKGYTVTATDDGHTNHPVTLSFDASWALTAPGTPNTDAVTDYFYRAVHTVALASKYFVQKWYSGALSHSYYFGCSDGGREGIVEATRYSDDLEGYMVGDPFFDIPGQVLTGRTSRVLLKASDSYILPHLLTVIDNAVYAACDATDGVKDKLIQNPGKCSFKPQSLLCKAGNKTNCLPQNQVDTLTA